MFFDGHLDVLEAIESIVWNYSRGFRALPNEKVLSDDTYTSLDSADCNIVEKFIE